MTELEIKTSSLIFSHIRILNRMETIDISDFSKELDKKWVSLDSLKSKFNDKKAWVKWYRTLKETYSFFELTKMWLEEILKGE